jgi:hypothetical protein
LKRAGLWLPSGHSEVSSSDVNDNAAASVSR